LTPLESYTKEISKLFIKTDHSVAIGNIEKKLVKSTVEGCNDINLANVIAEINKNRTTDLDSLLNSTELAKEKTTALDNIYILLSQYERQVNTLLSNYYDSRDRCRILIRNNARFAKLNIDIPSEFTTLNNLVPFTTLHSNKLWKLPTFTLNSDEVKNIKLPGLFISFNFRYNDLEDSVIIVPNPSIASYESQRGKFFHPHVNKDGRICWGDGLDVATKMWKKKQIVPLVQLLINVLSSYNYLSPYVRLKYWKKIKYYACDNCGQSVSENNVKFIDGKQSQPACGACVLFIDKTYVWASQYVRSEYHRKFILKANATKALTQQNRWDYFENILSMPEFTSCPKCFSMVHNKRMIHKPEGSLCSVCEIKMNNSLQVEEVPPF
jgi:hypothetical protein